MIGVTCNGCHSGAIDGQLVPGMGSGLADLDLFLTDMLPLGYPASLATFANLNRTRGTNNASDVNLAFIFPDNMLDFRISEFIGLLLSGTSAGLDTPNWWNMGHKPVKFMDGAFVMDAPRVDMVFYTPFFGLFGGLLGPLSETGQDWMRNNGPRINHWIETLKSPKYPRPINMDLAEEGAVLFHELDMWAPERNNRFPEPEGNGSCAGCHGAYAPRYVNDPDYLDSPLLEGMAGYVVPMDIIATDPVRVNVFSGDAYSAAGEDNFFGYPETKNTDEPCGPQNADHLRAYEDGSGRVREHGYFAQPLYGVWASAPYLHNGSIPDIWSLLKPSDRPNLWRRVSTPARPDQAGKVIMGFDTSMARAYDQQKMGWKYDEIECEYRSALNPAVIPYVNCVPGDDEATPLAQEIIGSIYDNLILVWNILFPPTLSKQNIEDKKIYNVHMYGQGNEGHEFNEVLSDNERRAIIEYLKTL